MRYSGMVACRLLGLDAMLMRNFSTMRRLTSIAADDLLDHLAAPLLMLVAFSPSDLCV